MPSSGGGGAWIFLELNGRHELSKLLLMKQGTEFIKIAGKSINHRGLEKPECKGNSPGREKSNHGFCVPTLQLLSH